MPEFSRRSLEILRQPLEDKKIQLSRTSGTFVFPANFMLVAAMNPCPCGYYPDMNRCHCTPGEVSHYLGKISQPLLDRIDLCMEIPEVEFSRIRGSEKGESSAVIRERVKRTRAFQKERWEDANIRFNGEMTGKEIEHFCVMTKEAESLLECAFTKMQFSVRSYHRILKVARTIADMDREEKIHVDHLSEALACRAFEKAGYKM